MVTKNEIRIFPGSRVVGRGEHMTVWEVKEKEFGVQDKTKWNDILSVCPPKAGKPQE